MHCTQFLLNLRSHGADCGTPFCSLPANTSPLASLHSCRCVSLFVQLHGCVHSLIMYVQLTTVRGCTPWHSVCRCRVVCCSCTPVVVSLSCRGLEQSPVRDMMRQQLATLQHSIADQRSSNSDLLNELLEYRSYLSRKSKLEHAPLSIDLPTVFHPRSTRMTRDAHSYSNIAPI